MIVIQEEIATKDGMKRKERELAIDEVKPEIWLEYIEKELQAFVKYH